jgi:hypothetical protein
VQFGFYDWTGEFWWILAQHNNQQEIILYKVEDVNHMEVCKPPSKEHPSYSCFYNLSLFVYRGVLIT